MVDELVELERRGWEALAAGGGKAFYSEHMDEAGLMILPGFVASKSEAVDAIDDSRPWTRYRLSDWRTTPAGKDAGLVTYRAVAQRGTEPEYRALMSSVYVRRPEGWRLLLHQQTPF